MALNAPQVPILFRHYKVDTVFDDGEVSGMRADVIRIDLAAMRSDPELETAVMMLESGARNNYGVRRFEAGLVETVLAWLGAESDR